MGAPRVAGAYCRTTTCDTDARAEDPSCLEDREGCSISGKPLRWERGCVSYSIEADGSPLRGICYEQAAATIAEAMSAWVEADCAPGRPSIEVLPFPAYECAGVGYSQTGPNANAWVFRDDDWPNDDDHGEGTLALTTVSHNPDTGEILDVDIEVNSQGYSLTEADHSLFAATALHESGHFFGLADVPRAGPTMHGYYALSLESSPDLTPDDIAGICAIHPPSEAGERPCDPEPHRGFSAACPTERQPAGCACRLGRGGSRGEPRAMAFVGALVLLCGARRGRRRALERTRTSRETGLRIFGTCPG